MSTPEIKDISTHVVPYWAPQWRQLGVQLGIADHKLDIIQCNYPLDCTERCFHMLSGWLKENAKAKWIDLINAVDAINSGKFIMLLFHVENLLPILK